jgi:hypothetical protein
MLEPRASFLRRLIRPRLSLRLTMAAVLVVGLSLGWIITRSSSEYCLQPMAFE